jgi:hypothetical protein
MSDFKNNMDAMFAKVFPAAAEAAEEDHGGFNLGDLIVILVDLVLLLYTGFRSWHFLSTSIPSEFQIMALVGLWGLDIGAVAWSLVWIFGSTTKFQNWVSMSLFVADLIGVMLTSTVDTLMYADASGMPPILNAIAWYGIPLIIIANVVAGFIYHMSSPATRRRRAEREQDETLGKQQEKANLELRRMSQQLRQAQQYTTDRAKFLVAFAEIAEQNITMADIEAQMLASLNKVAGGQLGSLMDGAGLALSSAQVPPTRRQSNDLRGMLDSLRQTFGGETNDPEIPAMPATAPARMLAPEPALRQAQDRANGTDQPRPVSAVSPLDFSDNGHGTADPT